MFLGVFMKKLLVVSMLTLSSVVGAQETQTPAYDQCPDFGGANGNDAELISATGLPLTPEALRALYAIAQQCAAQKAQQ